MTVKPRSASEYRTRRFARKRAAVALPASLARPLRLGEPPVVGRIESGRLLLDPRTLTGDEVEAAGRAVAAAL